MRVVALLVVLLLLPGAAALRVAPEAPVTGQPVAILPERAGSNPEIEVLFLRDLDLAALAGLPNGPHIHAPRVGGNLLHVPAGSDPPVVEVLHDGGARAWVGTPERRGAGWIVPIALPAAGTWALTVDGAHVGIELAGKPNQASISTGSGHDFLIAVESPLRPVPPSTAFTLQVARRAPGGPWVPHTGAVAVAFTGNATVQAPAVAPGRFAATLASPPTQAPSFLRVNVTGEGATGSASFPFVTLGRTHEGVTRRNEATFETTFLLPGPYLVLAHDWAVGLHAARRVEVAASGVLVIPAFPATVPLTLQAKFALRQADGSPVLQHGPVQIGLEGAMRNATADGRGNVSALVEFGQTGPHRIRFVAASLGIDRTFGVEVATGAGNGDQGGHQDTDGEEGETWWKPIPAPALLLAALAAALLVRRRG